MKFIAKDYQGEDREFYIDENLAKNLDEAKKRVQGKNWDYVDIIAGLPGAGKSTFSKTKSKYCDPNFSVDNIAFSDEEFIAITNSVPDYSAVVLDESFASLNTKVGMSGEFLRIINHLQLIRQKHLYITLCLPNFFDLSKGVAVFRASHLFVVYDEHGDRGRFLAWDREAKRKLYVLGSKYMDYSAAKANFHGKFTMNTGIIDENEYERRKKEHLLEQGKQIKPKKEQSVERNDILRKLHAKGMGVPELVELSGLNRATIYKIFQKS